MEEVDAKRKNCLQPCPLSAEYSYFLSLESLVSSIVYNWPLKVNCVCYHSCFSMCLCLVRMSSRHTFRVLWKSLQVSLFWDQQLL